MLGSSNDKASTRRSKSGAPSIAGAPPYQEVSCSLSDRASHTDFRRSSHASSPYRLCRNSRSFPDPRPFSSPRNTTMLPGHSWRRISRPFPRSNQRCPCPSSTTWLSCRPSRLRSDAYRRGLLSDQLLSDQLSSDRKTISCRNRNRSFWFRRERISVRASKLRSEPRM